jgi:hypothetical protein
MSLSANWAADNSVPYLFFEAAVGRLKDEWHTMEVARAQGPPLAQGWRALEWAEDLLKRGITEATWIRCPVESRRTVLTFLAVRHKRDVYSGTFVSSVITFTCALIAADRLSASPLLSSYVLNLGLTGYH